MRRAEVTLVCTMSRDGSTKQPKSRRILVIDDDKDSLEILLEPLRWEGYDARGVTSDVDAHKLIESWIPHVVILDWMAPSMAGLKVLRSVRERLSHVSCVFVSENSSTEAIIEALDAGADDYIVKPFSPSQLVARVRAVLRRTGAIETTGNLAAATLTLDRSRNEVQRADGSTQRLTQLEARLLEMLLLHPGQVLTTEQLISHVWGVDGGDRTMLKQLVYRLRSKIENETQPNLIETIAGVGYSFIDHK